jgi:hypothetical protein
MQSGHAAAGILVALLLASACSSGESTTTGGVSNGNLVSTCDQICANVAAQCVGSPSLEAQCMAACSNLNLVGVGCLDPFASYLACIAGATSVHCDANGQYVLLTPAQCESDRQAVLTCNASPGLVTACIALPSSPSCTPASGGTSTEFCVGAPANCMPPSPNPIGIGTYCCP